MAFNLDTLLALLLLATAISSAAAARILDEQISHTTLGDDTSSAVSGDSVHQDDQSLVFFMHDILGGTHPSAVAVTGIVSNPTIGGQFPFAKPNGGNANSGKGIIGNNNNNNNFPFLTGLSGFSSNTLQTTNGGNVIGGAQGFPFFNSAGFPSGTSLQKLLFGTMTVFDDELTVGQELSSGLVGKAQGFYIASSEDGTSQTMAFTVIISGGSYTDSLSFFGIHRPSAAESHLAIMGGTGKYVNAAGFAKLKTFPAVNQHETDGSETLLQISVHLDS